MMHEGIAYDIRGEGDWLLMIAGLGSARDSWLLQIDDLASRFRCITFDNRGVGESIKPAGPYSTAEMAADAAGLLSFLGVERTHVLGTSMGGAIAQELALLRPSVVDRLAIACSWAACDRYLANSLVIARELARSEGEKGSGWSIPLRRYLSLIVFTQDDFANAYELIEGAEQATKDAIAAGREEPFHAFVAQVDACLSHDTRARLASIRAPTLVLAGERDACVPPSVTKFIADTIPNAAMETMAGCGHVMFYEQPKEFNSRLVRFFSAASIAA
jgi:pimeloyl-ACP methyl ester carboxylesterase